jgi:1-aminocyclopropane-1-carboxylate deaminase
MFIQTNMFAFIIMINLQFTNIPTLQSIIIPNNTDNISLNVLRLDKIHPVISGNKWFKLQYYLADALENSTTTIATFGGAYSNHIAATAFACLQYNLKSIGIIRGEETKTSPTLEFAKTCSMQLIGVSRAIFRNKAIIKENFKNNDWYWINEGGYGLKGSNGASTITQFIPENTTHIIAAIGTGTTFSGLIKKALPHQKVIGINVLKANHSINKEVDALLSKEEKQKNFEILKNYHFGGYAKHPNELIDFMKQIWFKHHLPTDIVYTSKLMFAVFDLLNKKYFPANGKIAVVHSGGLQGNLSLPVNALPF